jgi:predicted component of type VI protein secretion system
MKAYAMSFDGALLERGFWLYVWSITSVARNVLYVGRTGDSSSAHASSPFRRIGQHLDVRPNARGNALARQLKQAGLVPETCMFEMIAVGPLFREQPDMEKHKPARDQVAALERALAEHLRGAGYEVLGDHPRSAKYDEALCGEVCQVIVERLVALNRADGHF